MILEELGKRAECWIQGEPQSPGLYLIRIENCGLFWYHLNECVFCDHRPDRMVYYSMSGGDYASRAFNGKVTHHCEATAKNFGAIVDSLKPHKFNEETCKYECTKETQR